MAVFDPKLIIYQIICLQSFHYVVLGTLFGLFRILFGTVVSLSLFFSAEAMSVSTAIGWTSICGHIMTAFAGSVLLALIVEKSKKCLDFTSTLFLIHMAICWGYGGLPQNWDWWIVQITCFIVMVMLGEYVCSRWELRDIPLFAPLPTDV